MKGKKRIMKLCKCCNVEKDESCFGKDLQQKSGLHPYCKECKATQQRKRNREKQLIKNKMPKTCKTCKKSEPIISFRTRRSLFCNECLKLSLENQKKNRKPVNLSENNKFRTGYLSFINRTAKKEELIKYAGGICKRCGISLNTIPSVCFDFHHLKGEKDFDISKFASRRSMSELCIEIDKCILLCANCHRLVHFENTKEKYKEEKNE